jgi:hypothetical protein
MNDVQVAGFLKTKSLEPKLGEMLTTMLIAMTDREGS